VDGFTPGPEAAGNALHAWVSGRMRGYDDGRNDPNADRQSNLSPYFHFGQLAPQRAAFAAAKSKNPNEDAEAFLEELVVRRELSDNFCHYNPHYDSLKGVAGWASKTLDEHRDDTRKYVYSYKRFEAANTHSALWNACQMEMVESGKMHGYMRMYWAKKILEWSESPEQALDIAIRLNDRFELDGRDPNGYVGCMWSIGGVHDRAWTERPILGKIRYMNERGCRRKFDVDAYIAKWLGGEQGSLI
jgi:deoxyribodipyrimidine photo-lyase